MEIRTKQSISGVLALSAVYVGGWAELAPESFYRSFPGGGHHWVSPLGPYNEHLTRDVGGLYLALAAVTVWAVLRPRRETLALVATGWLVFSVPHFVFHVLHLDAGSAVDKAGNVVALGGTVVLAALVLVPGRGGAASSPAADAVAGSGEGR
jgi:hypothetical protein